MSTKDIKQLANYSITDGKLNEEMVLKIAKRLNRADLRQYIKSLKLSLNRNTVRVSVSAKPDKQLEESLKEIFIGKNIQITQDTDLIAGIKIQDYDDIYDLNLQNTLNSMVDYIKKN